MRNRFVRVVFVGLILAFPVALRAAAPGSSGATAAGVEMLVLGGLIFASRERRRLLAGRGAIRTRPGRAVVPAPAFAAGATGLRRRIALHVLGR